MKLQFVKEVAELKNMCTYLHACFYTCAQVNGCVHNSIYLLAQYGQCTSFLGKI